MLRDNKIIINKTGNDVLINALSGGYHYPQFQNPNTPLEPVKDGFYEQCIDALGYMVINYYQRPKTEGISTSYAG